MPKDEALRTVHGYVEKLARNAHKKLVSLLRVPGLYRLVPGVFVKSTRSYFGPAAGFAAKELQTDQKTWRIDMTKCPYHDTCVKYHCPELCPCFCDSDDISYAGLHPKLLWHRTKTMPAWALLLVVAREFAVTGLRLIAVDNGRVIAAAWSGKIKTASTMVAICLMLLWNIPWLNTVCWVVIVVTTVYSGVEYFVKNKDIIASA